MGVGDASRDGGGGQGGGPCSIRLQNPNHDVVGLDVGRGAGEWQSDSLTLIVLWHTFCTYAICYGTASLSNIHPATGAVADGRSL